MLHDRTHPHHPAASHGLEGLEWGASISMPPFMPLVGGLLELSALYLLCVSTISGSLAVDLLFWRHRFSAR